jgi:hypothetical protein
LTEPAVHRDDIDAARCQPLSHGSNTRAR